MTSGFEPATQSVARCTECSIGPFTIYGPTCIKFPDRILQLRKSVLRLRPNQTLLREGETQGFGYEAFATADRVLGLLAALLADLRIDSRRVAENIRRSCITVTELADSLVRLEGLSFRQAHEIAAAVARAVVAHGGDLGSDGFAPFETAFRAATGRDSGISAAAFAQLVSPEHFVAIRDRFGGPGPQAIATALIGYRGQLDALERTAAAHAVHEAAMRAELQSRFDALGRPD